MFWLRCLVLLGLCLINNAFAAAVCTNAGGLYSRSSPQATADAEQAAQLPSGFTAVLYASAQRVGTGTYDFNYHVNRADGSLYQNTTMTAVCGCATSDDLRSHTIHYTGTGVDRRWTDWNPQPNTCNDNCVENFDPVGTRNRVVVLAGQPPLYTGTDPTRQEFVCNTMNQVSGVEVGCGGVWKPTGATCFQPLPVICQAPQVLNGNNQCETPACPTGQQRETSLGACKPIVCYAPLVKVGDICKLPECPSGQTYEFSNGAGSCVKNDPLCTTPLINKNGVCVLPICSTGMVLDSVTGVCKPNPVNNPNTTSGSGTGTGTGTGTTSGTTGTSGGGGSPTPITNTNGTTSAGTTNTTSPTPTGSSTNTSASGTCTTAPCGSCDPTKETCGNTFGGSCKTGFKCNGDAIQCAVAQATNKSECELQALAVDTEKDTAFIEGKAAFDAGTKALGKDGGIAVASGGAITINSSNPFSSSCPADMQLFTYKGTQYMLPLAQYCNIFQIMGNIMLLCASLIALKIIMKVD